MDNSFQQALFLAHVILQRGWVQRQVIIPEALTCSKKLLCRSLTSRREEMAPKTFLPFTLRLSENPPTGN